MPIVPIDPNVALACLQQAWEHAVNQWIATRNELAVAHKRVAELEAKLAELSTASVGEVSKT